MINEKLVLSLHLAVALQEMQVRQEALFYWHVPVTDDGKENKEKAVVRLGLPSTHAGWKHYAAFTSEELSNMLPMGFITVHGMGNLPNGTREPVAPCFHIDDHNKMQQGASTRFPIVTQQKETDSLAGMLIFLIDSGQLLPNEVDLTKEKPSKIIKLGN